MVQTTVFWVSNLSLVRLNKEVLDRWLFQWVELWIHQDIFNVCNSFTQFFATQLIRKLRQLMNNIILRAPLTEVTSGVLKGRSKSLLASTSSLSSAISSIIWVQFLCASKKIVNLNGFCFIGIHSYMLETPSYNFWLHLLSRAHHPPYSHQ